MVGRVLRREVGGKQNILVMNDEAPHAYHRIKQDEEDDESDDLFGEDEEEAAEIFFKEAAVRSDGLDRIHKLRGINFCVDLSAARPILSGALARRRTSRSCGLSAISS